MQHKKIIPLQKGKISMKEKRQAKILELIREHNIETQEELSRYLKEAGYPSTQGTISRDIRELKLTKVAGDKGRPKYAPILRENIHISGKYRRVLSEAIISMEQAENILVIKTVSGMAMACAAAIDSIAIDGIVGSIAGDDTIMCVVKNATKVPDVIKGLTQLIRDGNNQ